MKKHKSKPKNNSINKKARKEIETKLFIAFNEIVAQFGKAKKSDKVIKKFAKQLSKKINIVTPIGDSITAFIKEEEEPEPNRVLDIKAKKRSVRKAKVN